MLNNKSDLPRLLLIGGLSRSGTSMLQELCDHHPQISISYESRAFLNTGKRFPEYCRGLRKSKNRLDGEKAKRSIFSKFIYFWRFDFQILRRGYREVSIATIHKTYKSFFPNAAVVGDKYPSYLWYLSQLTAYDGIRIVIIYRDGRDVAQSILSKIKTDWENKKWVEKHFSTFPKIAARWVKAIEMMEDYADQIFIIRYEDLVTNPKAELDRLAEYLKVDPIGFNLEMISSSSIGKYRQMLTKEQIAEVVEVAGPTLERLGYVLD